VKVVKSNQMRTSTDQGKSFYYVMMFSASWALQILVTKLGFNAGAQVLPFQAVSILTALTILSILILPRQGMEIRRFFFQQPAIFWKTFLANAIQSGLGTCLSIVGISLTAAINAGFLVKLSTVTTVIFARLILKERLTAPKILMVVCMLSGAYLLTTKGQLILPRAGDLFILGACVCWSLGNVMMRKYFNNHSVAADLVTFQKPIAGFPIVLALAAITLMIPKPELGMLSLVAWEHPTTTTLLFAIGNGLCLAVTWTYLNLTLEVSTASYMTMMSMVTPVIVSVLALILLGETLNWVQAAGAGMIILAGAATYFSDIALA
jgi:drug/metabolite transporter (DMT)-like permease